MFNSLTTFFKRKKSQLRLVVGRKKKLTPQSAIGQQSVEKDPIRSTLTQGNNEGSASCAGPDHAVAKRPSPEQVNNTATIACLYEDLVHTLSMNPLRSGTVTAFGRQWQLTMHYCRRNRVKCVLQFATKYSEQFFLSYTLRITNGAGRVLVFSAEHQKMEYNSTHYCAIYDVCMKSLYSRDSSRWIVQAELVDFKTARDLSSKRAVHSTLPSSKHMPSQHQAISELRDRLAKEATHMKGLLATVREGAKGSNADRTNKLMEKALDGMSTLIAELANEAERTNINLQVELLATRQRFREDALANCNAELEKKSHQALVMEAMIRDLHAKLDQSITEARRNESLLSEARAKQEDTARLLMMAQQQCRNYGAAVERQRRYLARQAALEHNLRAEIAELEVRCESQEQYYERELEVAANRLTEAQTMLDDLVKAAFRHATEGELEIRQLQELLTTYEGQLNCAICMDKQRTVSFGCGHTACRDCAKPLRECHICRRAVHKLYTIYL